VRVTLVDSHDSPVTIRAPSPLRSPRRTVVRPHTRLPRPIRLGTPLIQWAALTCRVWHNGEARPRRTSRRVQRRSPLASEDQSCLSCLRSPPDVFGSPGPREPAHGVSPRFVAPAPCEGALSQNPLDRSMGQAREGAARGPHSGASNFGGR